MCGCHLEVKECRERKADQGLNSEETFSFREEPTEHERGSLGKKSVYLERDDTDVQEGRTGGRVVNTIKTVQMLRKTNTEKTQPNLAI